MAKNVGSPLITGFYHLRVKGDCTEKRNVQIFCCLLSATPAEQIYGISAVGTDHPAHVLDDANDRNF